MKKITIIIAAALLGLLCVPAGATTYLEAANSIMFKSPLGMLIPLGIENFVSATDAIMYYNYISMALLLIIAAFSGQSNESRFMVAIPLFAALEVFIGWLQAPDPTAYWGMIVGCLLLASLMYMNDMNHEKYGLPGPGTKVLTIAIMIIVFEASVVLMSDAAFNPFPEVGGMNSQKSLTCDGYGYSCDSNGNIDLRSSVTTVNTVGGTGVDAISVITWAAGVAIAMIKFIILVVGAVLLFSGVMVATYPALAASPFALLILGIMQIVIWVIYMMAFFNWGYKPSFETAQV